MQHIILFQSTCKLTLEYSSSYSNYNETGIVVYSVQKTLFAGIHMTMLKSMRQLNSQVLKYMQCITYRVKNLVLASLFSYHGSQTLTDRRLCGDRSLRE